MLTIKVKPAKESAKALKHPEGPVLGDRALWPNDSFTARRLADKSVVRDDDGGDAKPTHSEPEHPAG